MKVYYPGEKVNYSFVVLILQDMVMVTRVREALHLRYGTPYLNKPNSFVKSLDNDNNVNACIYVYIYIYENKRMKIKDRALRFTHKRFRWCRFSSVYKSYHFVLLIWRCLGIKDGDDVVIGTRYFRRFCDLILFVEQRFEFTY